MRGLAVLRDHGSRWDVLSASALFQSLRVIVKRLSDSSRFPSHQYQTHKNATSHDNPGYPRSCRPRVGSFSIASRLVFGSRRHSDFACCCLSYQCHRRHTFGAELGRPADVFDVQQVTQHNQTLSIQVFRHQVGGIDCATDLLEPELLVLLFLLQPKVFCLHVFDGAAPTAESQST